MSSPISYEAANEIIGSFSLPSAPAVFMDLHEHMQHDEPDIDAVAAIIARDPGLSALVLKTLNSPFFSLRNKVTSIRQATVLLGLLNVGNIVAGLALKRAMEEAKGPAPDHYWDSPVNVGMVAAKLAQRLPGVAPDEAYMLGLFHNVGLPLMMKRFDDYEVFLNDMEGEVERSITECEDERYNTNHAVIGYYVSRGWSLPDHIGELILRHHDVAAVFAEQGGEMTPIGGLLAAVKMAEYVDRCYWGKTEDAEWLRWRDKVLAYTGISSSDFADFIEDMIDMLAES